MKKYIINKLFVDGYERIAVVRGVECDANYIVHFLEHDEYLSNCEKTEKKHVGDMIEGNLSITNEKILIEFENVASYSVGDKIRIEGSLEIFESIEV